MTLSRLLLSAVLALIELTGCTSVQETEPNTLQWSPSKDHVLLVEMRFDLSEKSLGGTVTERTDWNEAALKQALEQIAALAMVNGMQIVVDDSPPDVDAPMRNGPYSLLPNPPDAWQPAVDGLRRRYSADYALFLHATRQYPAIGREAVYAAATPVVTAFCIVTFPLCLAAVSEQRQKLWGNCTSEDCSRASLVDLRTSEPVWSNTIDASDWRKADTLRKSVRILLATAPH